MKIAAAGAGSIVNIHATAVDEQKDVEVTAVVEKCSDKLAALRQRFGIEHQYETVEQMLKAGGVDALVRTSNYIMALSPSIPDADALSFLIKQDNQ